MTEIISEHLLKCNNFQIRSSDVSEHSANTTQITRLPWLEFCLLKLLYEDHMANVATERSLKELARRFNRTEWTICRAFSNLVKRGFSEVKRMGYQFAKRCITLCGFSWLENQSASLTASLNSPIPYIDLSKREENNLLDNNEEEICGKLEEDMDPETIICELPIPEAHKETLRTRIKGTSIGPNRLKSLLGRFMYLSKKKPIWNILGYLTKAIENEQRTVWQLKKIFWSKGMKVNQYAI